MNNSHVAYLSLGSNIEPEKHLVKAVQLLQKYGATEKISNVWESQSFGAPGPNYLNACIRFSTPLEQNTLKEQILLPLERSLGRKREENRFAPRTMDIDIVIFDNQPGDGRYWEQAFVVVPLSEIHPTFQNPITHEPILETATRLRKKIWVEARPGVLPQYSSRESAA